jgi:hypothetical protein
MCLVISDRPDASPLRFWYIYHSCISGGCYGLCDRLRYDRNLLLSPIGLRLAKLLLHCRDSERLPFQATFQQGNLSRSTENGLLDAIGMLCQEAIALSVFSGGAIAYFRMRQKVNDDDRCYFVTKISARSISIMTPHKRKKSMPISPLA